MIGNRYFIQIALFKRRYLCFKTKNQNMVNLIKRKRKPCNTNYSVPITKLIKL